MDDTHLITLLSGFFVLTLPYVCSRRPQGRRIGCAFPQLQAAEEGLPDIRREGRAYHHLSKDGVPEAVYFTRLPLYRRGLSQHAAAGAAGSFWQEKYPKGLMWCSSVA